jgi:hypothetical protein
MSDDDFRSVPSNKSSKKTTSNEKSTDRQVLLVESKWRGSDFIDKIKEQVSLKLY